MSSEPAKIDGKQFRNALGSFATGVTIVTTRDTEGGDIGLTANSFNSVSLDPPMVLWSLAKTSAALPAFLGNDHFAVHILAQDQQPLSDLFARRGADKFADLSPERGAGEVPLLTGCSARFQCRMAYRYEGGDHMIFVGEVLEFDHFDRHPLLFHSGRYGRLFPRTPDPANVEEVESSIRKDFLGYLLGLASLRLYRPVRLRCGELGLSDCAYYVLSLLAARHDCTAAEIDELIAVSGQSLCGAVLDSLTAPGLITVEGSGPSARMQLTPVGRERAIELFAIAKAAEETAAEALDAEEAKLLKELLKRVIRGTADVRIPVAALT